MAFCGALAAFAHGSWRIAVMTAVLALCGSVLAVTRTATLQHWQIALYIAAAITFFLPGGLLWMNYRATGKSRAISDLPAWLLTAQEKLGPIAGTIGVGIGLLAWLEMDFAYCMAHNIHLSEESVPGGRHPVVLAPLGFLVGLTAIGCGAWRLGTIATYISLGALVALVHTLGSPGGAAFVGLTYPLVFFFLPFILPPFHWLYNPGLAAFLAAVLSVSWLVSRHSGPTPKSRSARPGW